MTVQSCIYIHVHVHVIVGRVGTTPPSCATCIAVFTCDGVALSTITMHMRVLRANVCPAQCKFKG